MSTSIQLEMPDNLLEIIRRRAAAHGISVEEQAVRDPALVENESSEQPEEKLIAEIRRQRQAMAARGIFLTQDDLNEARAWGRK